MQSGDMLGSDGTVQLIAQAPNEPQALCDTLIETVRQRSAGVVGDDLALLAMRFEGSLDTGGQTRTVAETSRP